MITVLHLTPHLGGGVGRALSNLVRATAAAGSDIRHSFVCLESPEKTQFVRPIRDAGCDVVVRPGREELRRRIEAADIVQVEWWNHPATLETLCGLHALTARLLVWCHQSGLVNPVIPAGLADAASQFVLTSPCSLGAPNIRGTRSAAEGRITVISSGVGCEDLPAPLRRQAHPTRRMVTGYIGCLNFSKLHPEYVDWLAAVRDPEFRVRMVGDELNRAQLHRQCVAAGRPQLIEFRGYVTDVAAELGQMDVLAYLLNPRHYGTAENALIEAMAMGVVPVVLDNAAETAIVSHGVTGMVVSSRREFAEAIRWLSRTPAEREAMARRAASDVRQRFTRARLADAFIGTYQNLVSRSRARVDFRSVLGDQPHNWFLACQESGRIFNDDGTLSIKALPTLPHDAFEETKGSAFQFHNYFPTDPKLAQWAEALSRTRDGCGAP